MAGKSAFKELGLKKTVELIHEEIQALYALDDVPWIIGYSGGKDSTACVQLVWNALEALPTDQRHKAVYVISTDTLVENPIVSAWVERSLTSMREAAAAKGIPVHPHHLRPEVIDTFWVNLLGKGYPSPRHMFRWCTERLKIRPANAFITRIVREQGEAILVLGTRKQESANRARTMARHAAHQIRERLTPNASLMGSLIYTPIEDWSNDDVWAYLTQVMNPWNHPNEQLLGMYAGATEGGECPLVVDSSTPSCGDSRFGCWVCTLVDKDKSMGAMIQNDQEKEWMLPLLDLRNDLDMRDQPSKGHGLPGDAPGDGLKRERSNRDFRRIDGRLHLYSQDDKAQADPKKLKRYAQENELDHALVHGPYRQEWREDFLRKLLTAQKAIREQGVGMASFEVISLPELEHIRRIWVVDKHEIEDSLPRIYQEVIGVPYPGVSLDDQSPLDHGALLLLQEICRQENKVHLVNEKEEHEDWRIRYGMVRELISKESRFRTQRRRAGLFESLEKTLEHHHFWNEHDAVRWAREKRKSEIASEEDQEFLDDLQSILTPDDLGMARPLESGLSGETQ